MTKDFKYIKSFAKAQMDDTAKGSRLWKKFWEFFLQLAENDRGYKNFGYAQASFFLQTQNTQINETAYHEACRPSHCQYLEKSRINLYVIVGVIVGVAGTMSAILRLVCEKCAHFRIEKDMNHHHLPAVASDATSNINNNNNNTTNARRVNNSSKQKKEYELQENPMRQR